MLTITLKLKRPLVGLTVAAGLLVAAGPANGAVVSRDAGPGSPAVSNVTEELFGSWNYLMAKPRP